MHRFTNPRFAIMLVFAAFGSVVGTWAGSIPQVTAQAGVSHSLLGLALAVSTLAAVSAMATGGIIGRRFSNRAVLLIMLPASLLFTVGMMASQSASLFFACIVLQAAAMGLTDIFMNTEASIIEHEVQRPIFTAFHGVLSLSMAVFAIFSSFITASFGPLPSCLPVVIAVMAAWIAVSKSVPARTVHLEQRIPIGPLWWHAPLLLMGLAIGLSIAAEGAAVFWSAKLIQEQSPGLAGIYGLGVAFFGACQALLRFVSDRLRARFGEINVMLCSFATAALGFSVLGLSPPLAVNAAAFAAIGMGLASVSPCLFVLAASQSPGNRAAGMGVISLVAGLPRVMAPLLFGLIASGGGMVAVFGLASLIPLAGIGIVLWLRSHGIRGAVAA